MKKQKHPKLKSYSTITGETLFENVSAFTILYQDMHAGCLVSGTVFENSHDACDVLFICDKNGKVVMAINPEDFSTLFAITKQNAEIHGFQKLGAFVAEVDNHKVAQLVQAAFSNKLPYQHIDYLIIDVQGIELTEAMKLKNLN